ncbi:MAG: hypothetical protein DRG11_06735 [Epsilonproteobacteria bacterium]|nr:MAG: hypothetical protein DRG11_06735 [Campylobacterota bacterium]
MNEEKIDETLEQNIITLKQCQKDKKLDTCSDCDSVINCDIRKAYVKAVYDSMNKDKTGGFEF